MFQAFTQDNYIYLGDNKHPSTDYWVMKLKSSGLLNTIKVRIGIDEEKGLIELKDNMLPISSDLLIYLENGNFIKCHDYGFYEEIDKNHFTVYRLTKNEMEALCEYNIESIKFTRYKSTHLAYSSYRKKSGGEWKQITTKTAPIIKRLRDMYYNVNKYDDYKAIITSGHPIKSNNKQGSNSSVTTSITIKPNHVEAGRKYGSNSVPELRGEINTMTLIFKKSSVTLRDHVEDLVFNILDYDWIDNNKLMLFFSKVHLEFYMVAIFDSDGIIFVNNEDDPEPGEEYKTFYFKEIDKSQFKGLYK